MLEKIKWMEEMFMVNLKSEVSGKKEGPADDVAGEDFQGHPKDEKNVMTPDFANEQLKQATGTALGPHGWLCGGHCKQGEGEKVKCGLALQTNYAELKGDFENELAFMMAWGMQVKIQRIKNLKVSRYNFA